MSKYGAIRTEVDGINFHSKREAARYRELCLMVRAGKIRDLELQPPFPLLAYGGQVFNRYPHITERLGGVYLGEDARAAVSMLSERLRPRQ